MAPRTQQKRQRAEPDVVGDLANLFITHFKSPKRIPPYDVGKVGRNMLQDNGDLLRGIRKLQDNMSIAPLHMTTALRQTAEANKKTWGG